MSLPETFLGYLRPDGSVGCRNHVLVLAAMDSAGPTVRRIAAMVPSVTPVSIPYGRGQYGRDGEQTRTTLIGLAANPNVAACVVVSLEPTSAQAIAEGIAATGKPVEVVSIQQAGNPLAAAYQGARYAARLARDASRLRRRQMPISALRLGVECGGTDTTSGIAANPALGWVADRLVEAGGSVYLSETSEILGAEHLLAARARNQAVAADIFRIVSGLEEEAQRRGVDIRGANPVPDNIRGGITTIEEKSLGAILKGGSTTVMGVLSYGQRSSQGAGLYIMDTPAPAVESLTGLVAGGCQLIGFTTGVGNSIGVKLAPVVKICANPHTVATMETAIDVDVSDITLGRISLEQGARTLLAALLEAAEGSRTYAELLGEEEIAISRIESTI